MSEENKWYWEYCSICDDVFKYAKQKERKFYSALISEGIFASRILFLRCGNCFNYNKNPFQGETYQHLKEAMIHVTEEHFVAKYGEGIDIEDLR